MGLTLTGAAQAGKSKDELIRDLSGAKADTVRVKIFNQLSLLYLYEEKTDSAMYYAGKALAIAPETGREEYIADTYNLMGIIYRQISDNEQAISYLLKALKLYEKNKLYRKAARTLGNISAVFSDQQQQDIALDYLFKAVGYSEKARDSATLVSLYGNIFWSYLKKQDIKKANDYFQLTNTVLDRLNAKDNLSQKDMTELQYQQSKMNYLKANLRSAEGKYEEAIAIYTNDLEKNGDELGMESKTDIFMGLSENYYLLGQYKNAIACTDSVLSALREDSIAYLYMDVYRQRAKVFAGMKAFENAYNEEILFKTISDSILNAESRKAVESLKISYETEKKEQQIARLAKEKRTQNIFIILSVAAVLVAFYMLLSVYRSKRLQQRVFSQREELLRKEREIESGRLRSRMAELEQMALRAQMNPHFIFNSLNSVQHFVMNRDVEGVNKYLGAFAHLIRQTLNNSGKPVISLEEEIRYLDTYLSLERMKSNDRFSYNIDVDAAIDRSETFIPGMILQPFVENSIRHGVATKEKQDGKINVRISKNGKLICSIEDNGVGREKAGEIKRASPEPVYEARGMDITMNRIDTINKIYGVAISVNINDLKDPGGNPSGTRVEIEFPADME